MVRVIFRRTTVVAASAALALLIGLGGWLDYRATVGELRQVLRSQADAMHATIAAAARVQHAASAEAERALGQRLLENARLLAAMDARGSLDAATLDRLARANDMFRVVIFKADGGRAYVGGEFQGRGQGQGQGRAQGQGEGPGEQVPPGLGLGRGRGFGGGLGMGPGPPAGGSRIAQRLLAGEAEEIVSAAHASRGGGERVAAGVRRAGGGAIVLNAANRAASELDAVYSLDALVSQIAAATPELAYVVLQDENGQVARGPLAAAASQQRPDTNGAERVTLAGETPVLERRGAVALDAERKADLRIGMRLDEVRRAERRALVRITAGLSGVAALMVLALALGTLRKDYGALSERHARAQEALRRRDRLAAMGEMASTVAHEIRNPLNAIAMSAQRLSREYPLTELPDASREEAAELVDVIQRESSRINTTVQQFLEFARPRPLNLRAVSLAAWLNEVARSAQAFADLRGVTIDLQASEAPPALADADQLRQVLDNLVRNAVEASPRGGTVTIAGGQSEGVPWVEVRDAGPGIPPDSLPRIFDLYFTTKADGTGVGLAVAQQIVAAHGGTIEVDSTPGNGTRMTVRLPQEGISVG